MVVVEGSEWHGIAAAAVNRNIFMCNFKINGNDFSPRTRHHETAIRDRYFMLTDNIIKCKTSVGVGQLVESYVII